MFSEIAEQINWKELSSQIRQKTEADVESALNKTKHDIEDFKALISPAAEKYLESMAALSRAATQKRFGKTIQLYIPLYLSNECSNHCIYCGFNHNNEIKRKTLNAEEIEAEVKVLKDMGYEHILLLTGESPQKVGIDYIETAMQQIQSRFSQISLEVYPMSTEDYLRLRQSGLYGVYIYQETYHKERYTLYHPAGKKQDYTWRINTPDRLGEAQVHIIGLGALLGLEDWRTEAAFMAIHLRYLQKKYWRSKYAIAFPRMRPHAGGCGAQTDGFSADFPLSDKELAQMIWAFRIFDHDLEMSLTTRESRSFRDAMINLGITSLSAGSKTDPGGYARAQHELVQFEINDSRSPEEIISVISSKGYQAVQKNWDRSLE